MGTKRERLIGVLDRLIGEQGVRATGIEQVLTEAGVAKMTLYHHFRSKEELVLATVRWHDERFRRDFVRAIEAAASDPLERLSAAFDVAQQWIESDQFTGCFFVRCASEYPDPQDPIHRAAAEHKRLFRDYLHEQARLALLPRPRELADQLWMLIEGAITAAFVCGEKQAIADAATAGRTLLQAADRIRP